MLLHLRRNFSYLLLLHLTLSHIINYPYFLSLHLKKEKKKKEVKSCYSSFYYRLFHYDLSSFQTKWPPVQIYGAHRWSEFDCDWMRSTILTPYWLLPLKVILEILTVHFHFNIWLRTFCIRNLLSIITYNKCQMLWLLLYNINNSNWEEILPY